LASWTLLAAVMARVLATYRPDIAHCGLDLSASLDPAPATGDPQLRPALDAERASHRSRGTSGRTGTAS
jgi:hypothetical protein